MWEDPWPKPCYLFALVAGALEVKEDTFVTSSGRTVTLRIYTTKKNINKVDFALESLIKSMKYVGGWAWGVSGWGWGVVGVVGLWHGNMWP